MISELNSQACTPSVNASPPSYEKPTHDSRPRLVANHYHAGDSHPLLFAGFYRRFRLDPFINMASLPLGVVMAQKIAPKGRSMVASLMMGLAFGTGGILSPIIGKLGDIFTLQSVLTVLVCIPVLSLIPIYFIPEVGCFTDEQS